MSTARTKKRDGLGAVDLEAELQGDDVEIRVVVEFPVGKLGLRLERNSVAAVTSDPAQELGVRAGWVLAGVGEVDAPADKAAIEGLVLRAFREGKGAGVRLRFRAPIVDGLAHCLQCDKFLDERNDFDPAQLAKGPGRRMCAACEEFSGMF